MRLRPAVLWFLFAVAPASGLEAQAHFRRGDANHDREIDLTDGVYTLGHLFLGLRAPPCADAADANDDGVLDIADAVGTFNYLFLGGPPPRSPFPGFEADPTPDALGCLGPPIELTGPISRDLTLTRDRVYRLFDVVRVKAGATLTIEEGTTILGAALAARSLLLVERGARIVAAGTPTHPVVFTSEKPPGSRRRGDWGGVMVLGRGDNNLPGKEGEVECLYDVGARTPWGGGDDVVPGDSSGRLSHVRLEFCGADLGLDCPLAGLSLFGVGSGTRLDHIEVKFALDDGIELRGGSASLKHILAVAVGDDSFDYSYGWKGNGQFWVARQRGDRADRGFEADNTDVDWPAVPITRPLIANVTLVGDPTEVFGTESTQGLVFRRGTGTVLQNAVIAGFRVAGLDIDDGFTTTNSPANGNLVADHCVFYRNGPAGSRHFMDGEVGASEETLANGFRYTSVEFGAALNAHNIVTDAPPLANPFDFEDADLRPRNDALVDPFDVAALDPFFEPAPYRGAVPPPEQGSDWTREPWISYLQG